MRLLVAFLAAILAAPLLGLLEPVDLAIDNLPQVLNRLELLGFFRGDRLVRLVGGGLHRGEEADDAIFGLLE
jgi:hypothetical protein